jgi:hypothetical protein
VTCSERHEQLRRGHLRAWEGIPGSRGPGSRLEPPWYHFGTDRYVQCVQIVHGRDVLDDGDAHGRIYMRFRSAGGRKVASSNLAAPTTRKPARGAGFQPARLRTTNRKLAARSGSYPSRVEHASIELPVAAVSGGSRREPLVRRARLLAALGLAWHLVEAAIALIAGLAAGSIALVGFGADSVVEGAAGVVVLWRFSRSRTASEVAERRAQRLIGASFFAIASYVGVEAVRTLLAGDHPGSSWVGIGLAVVTLATMPPLAAAKARVGEKLNSAATRSEGRQNLLCAYLSAALLLGLGANALLGWWWADPVTALLIATVAIDEGRKAWEGEACDDCC